MTYKLFLFSYETEPHNVIRFNNDGSQTGIPFNPDNTDYQQYLKWLAEGNTPQEADDGAN